jgi:hypothetical protein
LAQICRHKTIPLPCFDKKNLILDIYSSCDDFITICILRQYKSRSTARRAIVFPGCKNIETNDLMYKMTNSKATMLFLQNCIHIVGMPYLLDDQCQYVSGNSLSNPRFLEFSNLELTVVGIRGLFFRRDDETKTVTIKPSCVNIGIILFFGHTLDELEMPLFYTHNANITLYAMTLPTVSNLFPHLNGSMPLLLLQQFLKNGNFAHISALLETIIPSYYDLLSSFPNLF